MIFKNIFKNTQLGKFLPITTSKSKNWIASDNLKTFEKNLKLQPDDWEYRHRTVRYSQNSDRYRTNEWKSIDWKNSVVIFGCSFVFGIGLDDADTISSQLSKILQLPVINMGGPGTSIAFSFHNNLILRNWYETPIAVINLWTNYDRYLYYQKNKILELGAWISDNKFYNEWTLDKFNPLMHGYFDTISTKNIWQGKTKYYEATFFNDMSKKYDIDFLQQIDVARDLGHIGRLTVKNVSEQIAKKINV